jgi:hypothetical protein
VLTEVVVPRSPNEEQIESSRHRPPRRFEVWQVVHSKGLSSRLVDELNVKLSTVLGYCAAVIEGGAAYRWSLFNVPDSVVDAVQSAALRAIATEHALESSGQGTTSDFFDTDESLIGLWATPMLKAVKQLLPEEFDYGITRLALAHLRRFYGPAGLQMVAHTAATAANVPIEIDADENDVGVRKAEEVADVDDDDLPLSQLVAREPPLSAIIDKFRYSPSKPAAAATATATGRIAPASAPAARQSSVPLRASQASAQNNAAIPSAWVPKRALSDVLSQDSNRSSQFNATAAAPPVRQPSSAAAAAAPVAPLPEPAAPSSVVPPLYTLPVGVLSPFRLFFTWQCLHRVACPLLVSLIQLAIVGLTSRVASLQTHTRSFPSMCVRALSVPKRKFPSPPLRH